MPCIRRPWSIPGSTWPYSPNRRSPWTAWTATWGTRSRRLSPGESTPTCRPCIAWDRASWARWAAGSRSAHPWSARQWTALWWRCALSCSTHPECTCTRWADAWEFAAPCSSDRWPPPTRCTATGIHLWFFIIIIAWNFFGCGSIKWDWYFASICIGVHKRPPGESPSVPLSPGRPFAG